MGLERTAAVLQGKAHNYATEHMAPVVRAAYSLVAPKSLGTHIVWFGVSGASALTVPHADTFDTDKWDTTPAAVAARVLADHARALVFLTADGVLPTVSSRGYVLRRVLRRAARYARVQGVTEPCLGRLVPVVVETMGDAYPEIRTHAAVAAEMATREESFFQDMLSRGWRALEVCRIRLHVHSLVLRALLTFPCSL